MKKILILTSLLFVSACSSKLVYIEPVPYVFRKTVDIPPVAIRVYGADVGLYNAYVSKLREQIEFHNNQISDYEESFEDETAKE